MSWDDQRARVAAGDTWAHVSPAKDRAPHAYQRTSPIVAPPAGRADPEGESTRSLPGELVPPSSGRSAMSGVESARAAREALPRPDRAPKRGRGPSALYSLVATDGATLHGPDGRVGDVGDVGDITGLVDVARAMFRDAGEIVIYAHETANDRWNLPARYDDDNPPPFVAPARPVGQQPCAWWTLTRAGQPTTHLYLAGTGGEWSGTAGPAELLGEVTRFRDALGFAWAFSGGSTLHHLIRATGKVGMPAAHPDLDGTADSSWRGGYRWGQTTRAHREYSHARAFDRSGSYLSAWGGTVLADGTWDHLGGQKLEIGSEASRPPGYWQIDPDTLAEIADPSLPDPFARMGPGPVWLTTPLAHLATELAGRPLPVVDAWIAHPSRRPLDVAAKRVRDARAQLDGIARDVLKLGYAAATQWLEFAYPGPHPMHRPDWRRTIVDRFVANTWRGLSRCATPPLALGGVDCAIFAVDGPDGLPGGLRIGDGLDGWKPKGHPHPLADVAALLDADDITGAMRLVGAVR